MNCIITAGPTFEPLDDVRRLTNFSTGRLGAELAGYLTEQGHHVTLLIGEQATYAGERKARLVQKFSTTKNLSDQLKKFTNQKVDVIFHAAAVSDFKFGKLLIENGAGKLIQLKRSKKISTRRGSLFTELIPTPKIITGLRAWFPDTVIIGWKFEANGKQKNALAAAAKQLTDCGTNACVANGPAYGPGFALVTASHQKHFATKTKLFRELEKFTKALTEPSF